MTVVKADLRNAMSLAPRSKGVTRTASPIRIHIGLALQWGKEREGNLEEEETALYFYFFLRTYLFVVSFIHWIPSRKLKHK